MTIYGDPWYEWLLPLLQISIVLLFFVGDRRGWW